MANNAILPFTSNGLPMINVFFITEEWEYLGLFPETGRKLDHELILYVHIAQNKMRPNFVSIEVLIFADLNTK